MAHALVPTACGRVFWSAFFCSRSAQFDPIFGGPERKKALRFSGSAVRGSRAAAVGSRTSSRGSLADRSELSRSCSTLSVYGILSRGN
jgi:hypothetical protein